jgi:hypothetical protein
MMHCHSNVFWDSMQPDRGEREGRTADFSGSLLKQNGAIRLTDEKNKDNLVKGKTLCRGMHLSLKWRSK